MRFAMSVRCVVVGVGWLAACGDASTSTAGKPTAAPTELAPLVGVEPAKFRCDSLLSEAQLADITHGSVRVIEGSMPPPDGTAAPCTYVVETARGSATSTAAWSFDIDCRTGARDRADALFTQYRADSTMLVEAAAVEQLKPRPKPAPGQPAAPPPNPNAVGLAVDVEVGARGLDHHGQALIFIDDDAPCYVRVTGPDAAARKELAELLAIALRPTTAPMSPRAADPTP